MKSLLSAGAFLGTMLLASATARIQDPREVRTVSPEQAKFKFLALGASRSVLWGDENQGPYGAYTKFKPGFYAPLHHHTSEMNFMVLKGAYIYKPEKGEEKRVEEGSYLFIPPGEPHACSADAKEGCLFYDVSQGKFDAVLGKKKE